MKLGVLFFTAAVGLCLLAFFSKFPLFSPYPSVDFEQHVRIATSYAVSLPAIPPLPQLLLYSANEFYLALAILLTHGAPPLFVIRYAMAALVLLSIPVFHLASREILESAKKAMAATAIYSTGAVWFGMVFNVGLYPNFLGMLASLSLAASVLYFERKGAGVKSLLLFIASLSLALFSHYSVLLVWPSLFLYLGLRCRRERKRAYLLPISALMAPLILGFALFPDLPTLFLSFVTATGGANGPTPTLLSSLIPLPALSYIVSEMSSGPFGDLGALVILGLGAAFVWGALKSREPRQLMLLAWFSVPLLVTLSPAVAWRSAFVALVPLTLMAGSTLAVSWPNWSQRGRTFAVAVALFLIVGGSWSANVVSGSSVDTFGTASAQKADYQAILWMKAHASGCGPQQNLSCIFVSDSDPTFKYSALLGGPTVIYAPAAGISWLDPTQTKIFALSEGAEYIITSTVIPIPNSDIPDIRLTTRIDSSHPLWNATFTLANGTQYYKFLPWLTFSTYTLHDSHRVYSSESVHVYCVSQYCAKEPLPLKQ